MPDSEVVDDGTGECCPSPIRTNPHTKVEEATNTQVPQEETELENPIAEEPNEGDELIGDEPLLVSVCERSDKVQTKIMQVVQKSDCSDVLDEDLEQISGLTLSGEQIRSLKPEDFSNLKSLKKLFINMNQLEDLPPGLFSGLKSLEVLSLSYNQIRVLPHGIFSDLTSLRVLLLIGNRIENLDPSLFSNLKNLQVLYLSENRINHIPFHLFDPLTFLREVYLNRNEINAIPTDIFNEQRFLEIVDLSNNQFENLDVTFMTFMNNILLINVGKVYLEGNRFSMWQERAIRKKLRNKLADMPPLLF